MSAMKALVGLAVIGGAAHYGLWWYGANQAEVFLDKMVRQGANHPMLSHFDVDYTLEKGGYPKNISLTLKDYKATVTVPSEGDELTFSIMVKKPMTISTKSLFDYNTFRADLENFSYEFDVTAKKSGLKESFKITGDSDVMYTLGTGGAYSMEGDLRNLAMTSGGTTFAKIKNATFSQNVEQSGMETITADISYDVKGMMIDIPASFLKTIEPSLTHEKMAEAGFEDGLSFEIPSYQVVAGVTDFPNNLEKLMKEFQKLQSLNADVHANGGKLTKPVDMRGIRKQLVKLLEDMAFYNSSIKVQKLHYTFLMPARMKEPVSFGITGRLRVNDAYQPEGKFEISLKGLQSLMEMEGAEIPQNPMLGAFVNGGPVTLQLDMHEGFLTFNGMPIAPLPNLVEALHQIPDTLTPDMMNPHQKMGMQGGMGGGGYNALEPSMGHMDTGNTMPNDGDMRAVEEMMMRDKR